MVNSVASKYCCLLPLLFCLTSRQQHKWQAYAKRYFMNEIKIFVVYLCLFCALTMLMVATEHVDTFTGLWHDGVGGKFSVMLCFVIPFFSIRFLYREHQQLKVGGLLFLLFCCCC